MFLFSIGFGLAVAGGVILIAYMNFLPAGITWLEYFNFIKGRVECYFLPLGIIIKAITLYYYPNKS